MSSESNASLGEAGKVWGLTEAEASARSTRHAAWVAAGAARTLWNGYTSARASDRAARTAADAAVQAVSLQLSGETEKSKAEFLRGRRQILYTKIIAEEREVQQAEVQTYNFSSYSKPKASRQWNVTSQLVGRFQVDNTPSVEIMASEYFLDRVFSSSLKIMRAYAGSWDSRLFGFHKDGRSKCQPNWKHSGRRERNFLVSYTWRRGRIWEQPRGAITPCP